MKRANLAGFVLMLAAGTPPAFSAERLSMTIRILDQANLPANTIHKMEKYIDTTLAAIDVDVKWVECATSVEACKALRGPNEFWLRILNQVPADVEAERLGFAQPGGANGRGIQCVNVIYPRVEELAQNLHVDAHEILGAALAHEIGHLYLGTNERAHAKSGIMVGTWSHREIEMLSIGELNFTREQGERIRTALRSGASL